jgi:hypothetical protein
MNSLEVLFLCQCEDNSEVEHKDVHKIISKSSFFSEIVKSVSFYDYTLIMDCRMELFDTNNLIENLPYKDSTTFSWLFPIMELNETLYIPYMGGVSRVSKSYADLNSSIFASVPGTINWTVVLLNNSEINTSGIMNFLHQGELNDTVIANFGFRSILTLKALIKAEYKLDYNKNLVTQRTLPRDSVKVSNDLLKIIYYARIQRKVFSILIDARSITAKYNGTTVTTIHIIDELLKNTELKVNLLVDRDGLEFHQKEDWLRYEFSKENFDYKFDVAIKLDQFWYIDNLKELHNYAWKVGCIFLDTIAYDINYPIPGLEKLWFSQKYLLDFIVFLSDDVREKFIQRFGELSLEDILILHLALTFNGSGMQMNNSDHSEFDQTNTKILITGNSYSHKELTWSQEFFQYNFPNFEIQLIDGESKLSNEEIFRKFSNSDIVFIPSRYEGFGLNISLALTFNKFIVVRKNRLNEEIFNTIPIHKSHFLFRNEIELINFFDNFTLRQDNSTFVNLRNWKDVSKELTEFLKKVSKTDTFTSFIFRTYYE